MVGTPEIQNDTTDWSEVVELQRAGAATRQAAWQTSAHVDEDRVARTFARARYWSQCGLPWRVAASRARMEIGADPPPVDPHDTFRRRFPEPVTETEKARARHAAHTAAAAMTRVMNPPHRHTA